MIWLATSVTPACGGAIADTGTSATQLTAGQAGDLRFMREEEKLARDVYQALGETWEVRAFDRIATAEQRHMDAMLALLEGYAVADPSSGRGSGDFQDATLAALYTQLVARGRTSLVEALRVGAEIEELDLSDLAARTAPDLPADIAATYANLARGSRNHLRAFHALLTARGETYTPTHLAQADYDAIVSSPRERGDGSCMGQGRGRHGGMGRGRDPGGMGQGGMGGMGQGGMGQGRGPRGRGQGGMGP
ncbi:DUF2202 domain-containing protein, partial [Myxococcota bacterium]|nr:DUF2202 domain-containing protein [Myxococcota bacterium]